MSVKNHNLFFTPINNETEFDDVLADVQEYISNNYSQLLTGIQTEEIKAQIKRYIRKFIEDKRISVDRMSINDLTDSLYTEMAEFGFLTKYVFGDNIEEINVNSWKDIEVQYSDGTLVKLDEHFGSPEHAVNVMRRMLNVSGTVLDNASPIVVATLGKNIRIAVIKSPIVDEDVGVAASIRIVNQHNFQKKDFIKSGLATFQMLDFLKACLRYGVSVCISGATGSGKTTVAGWLLSTIPDDKRIYTIENGSRELNAVKEENGKIVNRVVHTLTRDSENERQKITQITLLDVSLRFNPDVLVVAEMRGEEAYAAVEAANTGVAVLTTIHANFCEATWGRIEGLAKRGCNLDDATLHKYTTEGFPIVVFCRQLEDKSRKLMEIMECEITSTGERVYHSLYRYVITDNHIKDNKFIIEGSHEKNVQMSDSLKNRFIQNGMPKSELDTLLEMEVA